MLHFRPYIKILKRSFIVSLPILFFCCKSDTSSNKNDDEYGIYTYPKSGYQILLNKTDTGVLNYDTKNYLLKILNRDKRIIFTDSLFSANGELDFKDFNGDNVDDLLILYDFDVRSNKSYSLYLIDTHLNIFQKVKNFESIKNPAYNKSYGVIENLVASGRDWTQFYKISNDSIAELGYTIYWGKDENGKPHDPDAEYQKALQQIQSDRTR